MWHLWLSRIYDKETFEIGGFSGRIDGSSQISAVHLTL